MNTHEAQLNLRALANQAVDLAAQCESSGQRANDARDSRRKAQEKIANIDLTHQSFIVAGANATDGHQRKIAIDHAIASELSKGPAHVELQITDHQATVACQEHEALLVALADAEAKIREAERHLRDCETVDLAAEFDAAMDVAMDLGQRLRSKVHDGDLNRPINQPPMLLPKVVQDALERLPSQNGLNVPVDQLRARGFTGGGR